MSTLPAGGGSLALWDRKTVLNLGILLRDSPRQPPAVLATPLPDEESLSGVDCYETRESYSLALLTRLWSSIRISSICKLVL
jgi:hypothetical protein